MIEPLPFALQDAVGQRSSLQPCSLAACNLSPVTEHFAALECATCCMQLCGLQRCTVQPCSLKRASCAFELMIYVSPVATAKRYGLWIYRSPVATAKRYRCLRNAHPSQSHEFIGFGCQCKRFGDIREPKPCKFLGLPWAQNC